MNFYTPSEKERLLARRMQRIVDLSCRRDQLLGLPEPDLAALRLLAADYEAAHMPRMAADLRRRLEHYREREILKVW